MQKGQKPLWIVPDEPRAQSSRCSRSSSGGLITLAGIGLDDRKAPCPERVLERFVVAS
jgi:hypothetical protein